MVVVACIEGVDLFGLFALYRVDYEGLVAVLLFIPPETGALLHTVFYD